MPCTCVHCILFLKHLNKPLKPSGHLHYVAIRRSPYSPYLVRKHCNAGTRVASCLFECLSFSNPSSVFHNLLKKRNAFNMFSFKRYYVVQVSSFAINNPVNLLFPRQTLLALRKLYFSPVFVLNQLVNARYCCYRLC